MLFAEYRMHNISVFLKANYGLKYTGLASMTTGESNWTTAIYSFVGSGSYFTVNQMYKLMSGSYLEIEKCKEMYVYYQKGVFVGPKEVHAQIIIYKDFIDAWYNGTNENLGSWNYKVAENLRLIVNGTLTVKGTVTGNIECGSDGAF